MIILHRKFPPNGTVGQFLRKCSNKDNDVEWANLPTGGVREVPTGGTQGQFLKKTGSGDNDYNWGDVPSEIPTGGSTGNILEKTSSGIAWRAKPREVPTGGSSGYFLRKTGSGDDDYQWMQVNMYAPRTQLSYANLGGLVNLLSTTSWYDIGSRYVYINNEEILVSANNNICAYFLSRIAGTLTIRIYANSYYSNVTGSLTKATNSHFYYTFVYYDNLNGNNRLVTLEFQNNQVRHTILKVL